MIITLVVLYLLGFVMMLVIDRNAFTIAYLILWAAFVAAIFFGVLT